jgi:serine/threonine protein kinase
MLVSDDEVVQWTDFGLAGISDVLGAQMFTTTHQSGSDRFKAPELLNASRETFQRTPASDVYAFGSFVMQVSQSVKRSFEYYSSSVQRYSLILVNFPMILMRRSVNTSEPACCRQSLL